MDVRLNDYELLYLIRQYDETAWELMMKKYERSIVAIARSAMGYAHPLGYTLDDIVQSARIGLVDAIESYREDRNSSFGHFARVCMEAQVKSHLRRVRSGNQNVLNHSISFDVEIAGSENLYLSETLLDEYPQHNPVQALMIKERNQMVYESFKCVSPFEGAVLRLKLTGLGYREIADELEVDVKSVDNAIQRLRRKLQGKFD